MNINYDLLLRKLQSAVRDSAVCEDGELYIKSKLKYDVLNILVEEDKEFINQLYKELEYRDER